MNGLREHCDDYLLVRRAVGYKLVAEAQLLAGFVSFAEQAGATVITTDLAIRWTTATASTNALYLARRMRAVRSFARYCHSLDPMTEVPPVDLFRTRKHRPTPFVFSNGQVTAVMSAARELPQPLRAATFATLTGLLAATGMRISEAMRLDRSDLDRSNRVLIVRGSKFNKSREVLVHESTVEALTAYLAHRDQLSPCPSYPSLFHSTRGTRLSHSTVQPTFRALFVQAGVNPRSPLCRPRIHSFRHSFAVTTLIGWYRDGGDVAARLPLLSTYLGHIDPAATYWYLSAVPELLGLAAERLELAAGGRS